jgi:hypothetical protein
VTAARNSYLHFLNKPEHLAATWRPKEEFVLPSGSRVSSATPLLLDPKKTLSGKAKEITKAVSIYTTTRHDIPLVFNLREEVRK